MEHCYCGDTLGVFKFNTQKTIIRISIIDYKQTFQQKWMDQFCIKILHLFGHHVSLVIKLFFVNLKIFSNLPNVSLKA